MDIRELNDAVRFIPKAREFREGTRIYALSVGSKQNTVRVEFTAQNNLYPELTIWIHHQNKKGFEIPKKGSEI